MSQASPGYIFTKWFAGILAWIFYLFIETVTYLVLTHSPESLITPVISCCKWPSFHWVGNECVEGEGRWGTFQFAHGVLMEVCLWSGPVGYHGHLWVLHRSCQVSLEASVMTILSYFWSRWLMFHKEDDSLMGSRLDGIGVNEDNDDDNDIYITPFFRRTSQFFYLICLENVPLEEGKVLLICFSGDKT